LEGNVDITINGKKESIDKNEITVFELLKVKNVKMPEMVSVQVNGDILRRNTFDSTLVRENDEVNFLYFMGGGGII
jgi:sulfur carrier protein